MQHVDGLEEIFDELVDRLREELPGFGETLAIDSKQIRTHARARKIDDMSKEPDGRRDLDADFGKKTYREVEERGNLFQRVRKWFGYKLHLIVDADYELPVTYEVTRASRADAPVAHNLFGSLECRHPDLLDECEGAIGDKGYDDTKLITKLWDDYQIKPVIAIRDMWKDGEETRLVRGTRNVVYDYEGNVYCHCMRTGERRHMAHGGFEKDRESLKYRCPARHYGIECAYSERCRVGSGVRISLADERRVFTPLARSSYAWERLYKKRTAVERVNSRLDVSFGFEDHFIRGLKKMRLRVGLALVVMLTMALGRVKEKQREKMRSLVLAA